jgi:hypothetical protein
MSPTSAKIEEQILKHVRLKVAIQVRYPIWVRVWDQSRILFQTWYTWHQKSWSQLEEHIQTSGRDQVFAQAGEDIDAAH